MDGPNCWRVNGRATQAEASVVSARSLEGSPDSTSDSEYHETLMKLLKALLKWKSWGFMKDVSVTLDDKSQVVIAIVKGDNDADLAAVSGATM